MKRGWKLAASEAMGCGDTVLGPSALWQGACCSGTETLISCNNGEWEKGLASEGRHLPQLGKII